MDITSLSTGMAQRQIISDVGTAMLSKSLDAAETNGQQLVQMINSSAMELSVNPNIGRNIDISV